jgi:hypothetical protein
MPPETGTARVRTSNVSRETSQQLMVCHDCFDGLKNPQKPEK